MPMFCRGWDLDRLGAWLGSELTWRDKRTGETMQTAGAAYSYEIAPDGSSVTAIWTAQPGTNYKGSDRTTFALTYDGDRLTLSAPGMQPFNIERPSKPAQPRRRIGFRG